MTQGKKWVQAAGATVVSEEQTDGIEVSPLISYVSFSLPLLPVEANTDDVIQGGEGLEFLQNRTIKAPAVIESEE
jgi:UDP-N-acetylglucosamine/UDP-N-acetylgalactosamine diphosphorylase